MNNKPNIISHEERVKNKTNMEYNTSLGRMVIPEYGRNIQKMIQFAMTVEDREERNRVARAIINVMGQLNPHLRDVTDFKHKLWDHLFVISDFKLDVDSPYPVPERESFHTKPERVAYPTGDIRYRHYGKTVERLIAKGMAMEEGGEKEAFIEVVANLMKRSYLAWNRDSVNDDVIVQHLEELSKGKMKLTDKSKLASTSDILARVNPPAAANTGSGNNKKKGGGSNMKNKPQNKHQHFKKNPKHGH
jgi:hypothetical protein